MKLFIWGLAIVLSMVGTVFAQTESAAIARVGSIGITVYELKREMQRILPLNKSFHGGISPEKLKEVRQKALDQLIERAYMVRYALTHELSISNDALEMRLDQVKAKFKTTEALQKALGEENLDTFRFSVYRMLLAQKAEDVAVNDKVKLTEVELREFYDKNKFMYQRPRQYRASHILVKVDPSLVGEEREKLIARAKDLADKAQAGKDFYNLAYYNSDEDTKFVGGDIGYFHSGQVVKEFEDAIKELDPGDVTGPVETISGFHIIKLTDVQEARLMSFDEVRDQIKTTLEENRRKALYQKWMAELRREIKPEILHPDLKS